MRLRERDKRTVVFHARINVKEPDGTTYEDWDPVSLTIRGNVQPTGGRTAVEMYGERLKYMQTMYAENNAESLQLLDEFNRAKKGFGACVNGSADKPDPDYNVVSVRPWGAHTVIDLEAR